MTRHSISSKSANLDQFLSGFLFLLSCALSWEDMWYPAPVSGARSKGKFRTNTSQIFLRWWSPLDCVWHEHCQMVTIVLQEQHLAAVHRSVMITPMNQYSLFWSILAQYHVKSSWKRGWQDSAFQKVVVGHFWELCQLQGVRRRLGGVVGFNTRRALGMITEEWESASHKCESLARAEPVEMWAEQLKEECWWRSLISSLSVCWAQPELDSVANSISTRAMLPTIVLMLSTTPQLIVFDLSRLFPIVR